MMEGSGRGGLATLPAAEGDVLRYDSGVMRSGERVIVKSTPLGRAPQVKRELVDHDEDHVGPDDEEEEEEAGAHHTSKRLSSTRHDVDEKDLAYLGEDGEDGQGTVCGGVVVDIKFRPPRRAPVGGKWTEKEDQSLREIVEQHGARNWKRLASMLGDVRSDVQCLHRWNKVLRPGLSKGPWTADEDEKVKQMVLDRGAGNIKWSVIANHLPGRIGKQCRERWFNHLDPEIKKGDWAAEEDDVLFETQRIHGNRWSEIAKLLPGRTENAVKNRWNSSARKKWLQQNGLTEEQHMAQPLPPASFFLRAQQGGQQGLPPPPAGDLSPSNSEASGSVKTVGTHQSAGDGSPSSLPPHMRPPSIRTHSAGSTSGLLLDQPPSLVNSPITALLDQAHGIMLVSGAGVDAMMADDSLDFRFDDEKGSSLMGLTPTMGLMADGGGGGGGPGLRSPSYHHKLGDRLAGQLTPTMNLEALGCSTAAAASSASFEEAGRRIVDPARLIPGYDDGLKADDMEFASTVDLLSSSEFTDSTPTHASSPSSSCFPVGIAPMSPMTPRAHHPEGDDSSTSRRSPNRHSHTIRPPARQSATAPTAAALTTLAPSPLVDNATFAAAAAAAAGAATPPGMKTMHVVANEQLQRAATVAMEQIVAASRETEVPLSMLPYYHFLNERGQRSIMNQLMAQFSQTSIAPAAAAAAPTTTHPPLPQLNNSNTVPNGAQLPHQAPATRTFS